MLRNKLAIPAAAIVVLGTASGLGQQAGPAHARPAQAAPTGSVAITDWQFPVSTGLGGNTTASAADAEISAALTDALLGVDAKGNFIPDMATDVPSTKNGGI